MGTDDARNRIAELERKLEHYQQRLDQSLKERAKLETDIREMQEKLDYSGQRFTKLFDDMSLQLMRTKAANLESIHRLSLAAEFKDEDTGAHIDRMSYYSAMLAEKLGLPKEEVETLFYAAPMHDVGKIGIPDSILLKPGKLTEEEHMEMRKHTIYGGKILANSQSEIIRMAHSIAVNHHEKWNGAGYPHGIAESEIPIFARIVHLADMFDALTSRRPYKDPYPPEVALEIVKSERGKSLDPQVFDIFLRNFEEVKRIRSRISPADELLVKAFTFSERDHADGIAESVGKDKSGDEQKE